MTGMVTRTRHYRMEPGAFGHPGIGTAAGIVRSERPIAGRHTIPPCSERWWPKLPSVGYSGLIHDRNTTRSPRRRCHPPRNAISVVLATGHGQPDETALVTVANQKKHGIARFRVL